MYRRNGNGAMSPRRNGNGNGMLSPRRNGNQWDDEDAYTSYGSPSRLRRQGYNVNGNRSGSPRRNSSLDRPRDAQGRFLPIEDERPRDAQGRFLPIEDERPRDAQGRFLPVYGDRPRDAQGRFLPTNGNNRSLQRYGTNGGCGFNGPKNGNGLRRYGSSGSQGSQGSSGYRKRGYNTKSRYYY